MQGLIIPSLDLCVRLHINNNFLLKKKIIFVSLPGHVCLTPPPTSELRASFQLQLSHGAFGVCHVSGELCTRCDVDSITRCVSCSSNKNLSSIMISPWAAHMAMLGCCRCQKASGLA